MSEAAAHWEMIVIRSERPTCLMIRGAETRATIANCPEGSSLTIIRFRPGTFMPHLPMTYLVDQEIIAKSAGKNTFWLGSNVYEYPTFENIEVFADKLVKTGQIAKDEIVTNSLAGNPPPVSLRHVQRRFHASTGMSFDKIRQINRIDKIVESLSKGSSIMDAVLLGEYADQPHLTRALKHYRGYTPAQLKDTLR
jgi:hypothetical protein